MRKFKSTRGSKQELTGAQAIIQGLSEDKGLYVPTEIPAIPFNIEDMMGKTYQEIALAVIGAFFDDYTEEEMQYCINGAYDEKFEAADIAPIVRAGGAYFLELYHGRTAAFKDMALSILPYLLTTAIKKENEDKKICILTATSGDTGKAALEGFADVPGTEIIVFFPNQGVSQVQERQMITQEGANTHVFAINGNFDDAQTGVKKIFNDNAFAEKLAASGCKLSSANSINIGRLVPQVAYYVYSYIKLVESGAIKNGEKMNIVVPTGNFGNILAGYYAKQMGIPVGKFICASNENKVLTDFINTGIYDIKRDFYLTNSPSMDILISSNLERLLYHLSGGNGEEIKALMAQLDTEKVYKVSDKIKAGLADFYGGYADVAQTNETISQMYAEHGYLMDTHTAVAYKVYEDYRKETGDTTPTVIASTASAYKFAESVAKSIGLGEEENGFRYVEALAAKTGVRVPKGLKDLDKKEVRHTGVINIEEMMNVVEESVK
ncbi:threonine synthase [Anaerovoracaceae bacterium 41-7]|uniref:Threonine synthase n=1 Tax=Anaerotruncus colihominis TaxID=169435 RepID=A0A845QNY2_9FIRM|nr:MULTISPECIES: threonine synthase [Eubacteriales]MCI9639758.1 threonine synthase [Emergencia sp.]NBH62433.1 threonine synthase [Anaerotruncus colihominis]NCF03088.1 threonine synthase [Anaerotruncus sp. 80]